MTTTLPDIENGGRQGLDFVPWKRLASAIIIVACREAKNGDPAARAWIESSQQADFLLDVLNLPSGADLLRSLDSVDELAFRVRGPAIR